MNATRHRSHCDVCGRIIYTSAARPRTRCKEHEIAETGRHWRNECQTPETCGTCHVCQRPHPCPEHPRPCEGWSMPAGEEPQ